MSNFAAVTWRSAKTTAMMRMVLEMAKDLNIDK
jgi:hypothetical protein